jgi:uncharacterized protein YecE (DUF72 family)
METAAVLGDKLGPVLFQLPPTMGRDAAILTDFLALLPPALSAAFEFRHPSWFDERIFALLAEHNAALCGGDSDEDSRSPPFVATARFGYLRLRAATYDERSLRTWAERIVAERWTEAYVFLKHEVLGPQYATFLRNVTSGIDIATLGEATSAARTVAPPRAPARGRARRTIG